MNVSRSLQLILIVIGLVASVAACRTREIELSARYGSDNSQRLLAKAVLASKSDSQVTGEVELSQLVTALTTKQQAYPEVMAYTRVAGLDGGAYTLRIHDAGNCDSPASSGGVTPTTRALRPNATGDATLTAALSKVTLVAGDARGLIGKTVVVHRGTGAEGAPVACGVIAKVEPPQEDHHGHGGEHAEPAPPPAGGGAHTEAAGH